MSLENLLNHKCDIYHIREDKASPGYNLPSSPVFTYSNEPDISGQVCHFGVKSQRVSIIQLSPQAEMEAKVKLTLPIGSDLRLNDKIVDCDTGLSYTAENPMNIRNHHMFVYIKKIEGQKAL